MMLARLTAVLALVGLFAAASPLIAAERYQTLRFDQLLGWESDDQSAALSVFLDSCEDISAMEWKPLCALAATKPPAREFFETFFTPVVAYPGDRALFTGYFEPVLNGSLYKVGPYRYPIYQKPKGLTYRDPELTRARINAGALEHKGLEIAYVEDPVAAYYLHIQGSGRIKLTNGNIIRVGYAGETGHVYRSAAKELIRTGELTPDRATIEGIREWYRANPVKGQKALEFNASYVFFRRLEVLSADMGPLGALERPMTGLRSIAVDPRFTQMGAPVWIEKGGRNPIRSLMIAQDVGAAIKGPQRADIYYGTGEAAGKLAGRTRDGGRMVVLLPNEIALELDPDG